MHFLSTKVNPIWHLKCLLPINAYLPRSYFLKRAGPIRSDQFGFFSGYDFEQILN
jgi:hypothetical protein